MARSAYPSPGSSMPPRPGMPGSPMTRPGGPMPGRPGWQGMEALQQGRSCGFEPARYEVLIRPGPRMGEAALLIADCLGTLPPAPAR